MRRPRGTGASSEPAHERRPAADPSDPEPAATGIGTGRGRSAPELPAAPGQPLGWTRLGVGMVAAGYALAALQGALGGVVDRTPEIVTALATALAFVLSRRRPRLASAITLVTVWAEVSASLLMSPNPRTAGVLVYPALAAAAGFLLGGRVALALAVASVAVLAVDTTLDGTWGPGPGGDNTHWVLVASLATLGGAVLARAVRRSYAAVLLRSEEAGRRYADLFASAPDGLVALGLDGRIAEANAAAAELLGATPAALVGAEVQEALGRAGATGALDLTAAGPGSPVTVALEREGGRRALEVSARPGQGGPSLLVVRDVTQRRLVEERLGHAQRLESVGQLAGGVAHDFNNLLLAISGSAAMLAEHGDPAVRELAKEVSDAGRRGAALTRQLLAFARRDAGRPERLDLAEVLSGMARLLERVLGARHRLVVEADGAVPVLADRAQLEQVAMNLVGNARDAMPDGGTVRVATRLLDAAAASALGSTVDAPRQALLEVADTGVGMSPEVRARIFEPFFSTKPRGEGTGLGLATVHGIAVRSGGQVAVVSAPGRGATFRVFLPAA